MSTEQYRSFQIIYLTVELIVDIFSLLYFLRIKKDPFQLILKREFELNPIIRFNIEHRYMSTSLRV